LDAECVRVNKLECYRVESLQEESLSLKKRRRDLYERKGDSMGESEILAKDLRSKVGRL
jgi:hypothetical protein